MKRSGLALVAACWAGWAAADGPDLAALARRLDTLFQSDASIARLELTAQSATIKRHLTIRVWSRGQEKSLIVVEGTPREAGNATLKIGNNLWNYLPNIARTIRIPPSMMLASWMGTDFTNDDLVHKTSMEHDFTAALEGPSQEPPGWIVVFTAKPGLVGRWQKIREVVDPTAQIPIRSQFYDRKGRLARTMVFSDVRAFGGQTLPTRITLTSDEEGRQAEIHYLDIQFGADVPESTFSLSRLEKK